MAAMIECQPFTRKRFEDLKLAGPADNPFKLSASIVASWAFVLDGHTIAAGGLISAPALADDHAVAWSYIGVDAGPHFADLVSVWRRLLDEQLERFTRIDALMRADDVQWRAALPALGFVEWETAARVTVMAPDGVDRTYVRYRKLRDRLN